MISYIITISDLSDVKYSEILVDLGLFVITKFLFTEKPRRAKWEWIEAGKPELWRYKKIDVI